MKFGNLVLLLAMVLGITGCATAKSEKEETVSMKLMTYNIRIGKGGGKDNKATDKVDFEPVAKLIENEKPDLVGLQEVDRFRKRTALMNQPEILSTRLKMNVAFEPAWVTQIPGGQDEEYGNALLSGFPILGSQRFALFKPDYSKSNPNYPDYYSEQRGLLHARVRVAETTVHVFATHLGLTPDQREEQIAQIIETMAKYKGPKVLFGDFNAKPDEASIKTLSASYTDVLSAAGVSNENRKSFPAGLNPNGAIDYIFVSPEFEVISAKVIRDASLASDHNPVVAEVRLHPRKLKNFLLQRSRKL